MYKFSSSSNPSSTPPTTINANLQRLNELSAATVVIQPDRPAMQRCNDTMTLITMQRHIDTDIKASIHLPVPTIILNTQLSTRLREPINQIINASSSPKPTVISMQLTTLTTMLFAAVAIASPIALPAKEAAANIEVTIIP
jgi:hypothetical protein